MIKEQSLVNYKVITITKVISTRTICKKGLTFGSISINGLAQESIAVHCDNSQKEEKRQAHALNDDGSMSRWAGQGVKNSRTGETVSAVMKRPQSVPYQSGSSQSCCQISRIPETPSSMPIRTPSASNGSMNFAQGCEMIGTNFVRSPCELT